MLGFGEMLAALGRSGAAGGATVRRPDAFGARIDGAAENPWFSGAVVPPGAVPPADDPELPYCLWTTADAAPGRVEEPRIATPCMGVALDDPALARGDGDAPPRVEVPSLAVVGEVNERAYDDVGGAFGPLMSALRDDRVRAHGLREDGAFVCVALSLTVGDDVSIQYVATEAAQRGRGLASRLLVAVIDDARAAGLRTATLQASPDGLSVYTRLGFRRVALLRGFVRPGAGA